MQDKKGADFEPDASTMLTQAVERLRARLHEAAIHAPPQVYQAIERLRELAHESVERTEQQFSELAHELGESEEDLLEWLKLDIRSLEKRMLNSMLSASDTSRAELQKWLSQTEQQDLKED